VSVSRELSKLHEETIRGTAAEVLQHFEAKPPKGEIVAVLGGKTETKENKKNQE
jgi:16S rRNA (cytidine1402-2'-O)-methyltransferase